MEAKLLTTKQYCPFRKVPLDLREILINQVNREAEINSYFMDRKNYYQDQMTASDRLGKKYQSPLLKYLFILGFMVAFVYFTSALIGSM